MVGDSEAYVAREHKLEVGALLTGPNKLGVGQVLEEMKLGFADYIGYALVADTLEQW